MTKPAASAIIAPMIRQTYSYFDLRQIAASGQCFRMRETGPGQFTIISRGKILTVSQEETSFSFSCGEEDFPFWEQYFDLTTDYGRIQAAVSPKDPYLQAAAQAGKGIRILRQDPWEMIITFVISQQKTIPMIREAVERLSASYGSPIPGGDGSAFAFPTPEQLNRATVEQLRELKLGYRAKYIKQLCGDAVSGALDLKKLEKMNYGEAMEYLTGFYGIGVKVANCICLFGLHHIDAFPVDTWIQKILLREYYPRHPRKYAALPKSRLYSAIIRDFFGRYRGCAGVMQQYIFYYERLRQNKTGEEALPESGS